MTIPWPDTPSLGATADAYRLEIRSWIADNRPAELDRLADWNAFVGERSTEIPADAQDAHAEWTRRLLDARLICAEWPREYGGGSLTPIQAAIFAEELEAARAPKVSRGPGELMVGPAILTCGSEDQKSRFLARIVSGEDRYCQGFSEPDAGSDLAAVRTRGEIVGDEIVLNGRKIWTSESADATHIVVLCRTDASRPKHKGLSLVILPMDPDTVSLNPIRQMTGGSDFAETVLEDARAPLTNVIGGPNNGWEVISRALQYERGGAATVHHMRFRTEVSRAAALARRRATITDPDVQVGLAWAYAQVEIMRYHGLRTINRLLSGQSVGEDASLRKLVWSEYHQKFAGLVQRIIGDDFIATADPEELAPWRELLLMSRAETIYAGTSEVQRNIIGERTLGLPREPKPASR